MKFLVPNYNCLQNPWLEDYRPQIPVLSVLSWICWAPPPNKIPGYPLSRDNRKKYRKRSHGWRRDSGTYTHARNAHGSTDGTTAQQRRVLTHTICNLLEVQGFEKVYNENRTVLRSPCKETSRFIHSRTQCRLEKSWMRFFGYGENFIHGPPIAQDDNRWKCLSFGSERKN